MRDLTFRSLRIFEAAATNRSFTRAAEALDLTPAAVSLQVKLLEDEVRVALFDKQARPIRLTDAGRELLTHAQAILAQVRVAQDAMQSLEGSMRGQLHVGVVSTAHYFAPRLMAAFRQMHPEVRMKLSVASRDEVLAMLDERTLDVAIAGYPPAMAEVEADTFGRNPHCIVALPDHPLAGRHRIQWAELANEPFLFREPGSATRLFLEQLLQARAVSVSASLEFQGNETIKAGVMAGMGISFMSAHACQLELEAGYLATLDVVGLPSMLDWCLLHRRDSPLHGINAAFREFVMAQGPSLTACKL